MKINVSWVNDCKTSSNPNKQHSEVYKPKIITFPQAAQRIRIIIKQQAYLSSNKGKVSIPKKQMKSIPSLRCNSSTINIGKLSEKFSKQKRSMNTFRMNSNISSFCTKNPGISEASTIPIETQRSYETLSSSQFAPNSNISRSPQSSHDYLIKIKSVTDCRLRVNPPKLSINQLKDLPRISGSIIKNVKSIIQRRNETHKTTTRLQSDNESNFSTLSKINLAASDTRLINYKKILKHAKNKKEVLPNTECTETGELTLKLNTLKVRSSKIFEKFDSYNAILTARFRELMQ